MASRFVIEGTWSGYTSSRQRIAHRTVHAGHCKALRAWAENTHGIRYTDGTMLYLSVRDCKPRERVIELTGYRSLIQDCARYGVASVEALETDQEAARAKFTKQEDQA